MMNKYITWTIGNKSNFFDRVWGIGAGIKLNLLSFLINAYGLGAKYLVIILLPLSLIYIYNLYNKEYNKNHLEESNKAVINGYNNFAYIITSFIYIALPLSSINIILFSGNGIYHGKLLMSLLILLWCADVGAYCFGSLLGKKFGGKLFPSISPKKSWMGFWGGLITCIIGSIIRFSCPMLEISFI